MDKETKQRFFLIFLCIVVICYLLNLNSVWGSSRSDYIQDESAEWDYKYSIDGVDVFIVTYRHIEEGKIKCQRKTIIEKDLNGGWLPGGYKYTEVNTSGVCN